MNHSINQDILIDGFFSKMPRGILICFEGVDHCGKTTQAQAIANKIMPACVISFPNRSTYTGQILDSYLKNKINFPNDKVQHLLFSANRWEMKDNIISLLEQGVNVILDRYSYSGIAYSMAKNEKLPYDWCLSSEQGLPKPDVVFYFSIDPSIAAARCVCDTKERYEEASFLNKVSKIYETILFNPQYWVRINASSSEEEITQQMIKYLDNFLPSLQKNSLSFIM